MSQVLANLKTNNLELPILTESKALFKPYMTSVNTIYISGQLPLGFGELKNHVGQLGRDFTTKEGKKIAQICALNVLYHLNNACDNNLDKVKKCVKITVFVNSTPDYVEQPQVANSVSELMLIAFGDVKGAHARSAIGVAQLPLGVAVEVEAIFEI